jgi:tetratricopeptide (TPR) repeat protein
MRCATSKPTLASAPENGWARYESANVLSLLGHWDDAATAYEQARRSAEADGDRNLAGAAASGLGTLAWRRGQLADAERHFETAETEFSSINRRANLASAVGNLGILADNRGQFELARERYETALALYREEGERAGESATYSNLAVIERKLGRLDTAAQMQQRAIDLQREIGLREMLVFSLTHLGEIERGRGRWAQASPILDEAVGIARDVGYRIGEAEALTARGALLVDLGRRDRAESDLRAARAIYGGLDNPHGDARSALQLSSLLRESAVEEARQLAQHAATVAERIGDEPLALEAGLLQVELGTGNAAALLPRLQALGDHRLLALHAAARARRADDPAQQRVALQHAESAGNLRLQAELAVELARMLLRRGETRNIDALIGRAESWMRDYPPALTTRACQLAANGRNADARRLLERARTAGAATSDRALTWCPAWADAAN